MIIANMFVLLVGVAIGYVFGYRNAAKRMNAILEQWLLQQSWFNDYAKGGHAPYCKSCGLVDWRFPTCPHCDNGKGLKASGFFECPMYESIHFSCDCGYNTSINTKYNLEFMDNLHKRYMR